MRDHLQGTRGINGGSLRVLDLASIRTSGFDRLDDPHGLVVSNLAENDVLAIEPGGDDSCDEELGSIGIGPSVGHGEETGLGVLDLEVLVLELFTVDGLSTSAVATCEVTTLEHEVWDDTVELGAGKAEAQLASS